MDLAVDGYDSLWVGTAFGLSLQSLGEIYFTNIMLPDSFGPAVTAVAFDAQGNLYAGSARGLVVRDIATGSFEYLTSRNSGLVGDDIKDIYYQSRANVLWISTSSGISRLTMPYAMAVSDVKQTLAYPNPFVIRYGDEVVRFNYAGMAEVRIYTLAGELVREIPVTGVWDGKNGKGQPAAAGVYIFVITDQQGENGRGKIFLIRE
jgi:ligand-binding sensor domain-containing protein